MQIKELSRLTGLQDKTIRYYEEIGVLPPPKRLPNGYRNYDESDLERVKFVMGMRRLDFSLDDISEILAMRDRREAPCRTVLDLILRNACQRQLEMPIPLPQIIILPGISITGNGRQDFSSCFALDPTVPLFNKPIFDPALKCPQLAIWELTWILLLEFHKKGLRIGIWRNPQFLFNFCPNLRKGIRAGPPPALPRTGKSLLLGAPIHPVSFLQSCTG